MFKSRIIGLILAFFYKIYASTFRYELVFEDQSDKPIFFNDIFGKRPHENNLLYGFFHQSQIGIVSYFERKNLTVMVSPSRDGEIIATLLNEVGFRLIRGSSSKNPKKTLLKSFKEVNDGYSLGITVDGPRGPAFKPKEGIITISKETGRAIVPISIKASKYYIFDKAWDKTILPYPFSKIQIVVSKIKKYTTLELEEVLGIHKTES